MKWQDMVIRRSLRDEEIATGLAHALRIEISKIVVCRNTDDFTNHTGAKVVCLISERSSGFKSIVNIYPYFDASFLNDIAVVQELADEWSCDILISDNSPNPYTMLQVVPHANMKTIGLDVEQLDNEGEYHIKEVLP